MDFLTPKYWSKFIHENGRFNGLLFEKLVKKLLPTLGLDLKETQISWDRARDFEDKEKRIWAECKMYKKNVSTQILSPTLVMAVIDNPNKIYFFSYSSLNKNAVKYLSQFQENKNLTIYIIDNNVLENLILNNHSILHRFFNFSQISAKSTNYQYDIKMGFSKDPDLEYAYDLVEDPKNKILNILSIFVVDIFLRNLDYKDSFIGEVYIDYSESNRGLLLLNKALRNEERSFEFTIQPSGVFFKRLYFKALRSGDYKIPGIRLKTLNSEWCHKLKENQVKISSIVRTNLIGKNYTALLMKFKELVQGRHQPVFITIYGESGTGKSRMLQEFTESMFEEEFLILKYDGESTGIQGFRDFIRKIFSKLYRLPLIKNEDPTGAIKNEFIYRLLYQADFNYRKNSPQILANFLKALISKKVALVIDNLQNYDEQTAQFLGELITECENTSSQFVLISCFNSSTLYCGTKNYELWDKLCLKGSSGNRTYLSEEITGFEKNAFNTFLDSCIKNTGNRAEKSFSDLYPETAELFSVKVLNRPLFIEQTLLYLEQKEAVERVWDSFVVRDIRQFHEILNNDFPNTLSDLLTHRWNFFLSNNPDQKENFLKAINFLVFFNHITYVSARDFGIHESTLTILINYGFVSIDQKENVSFYHFQLLLFFKKEIGYPEKQTLLNYKQFLENMNLTDKYFYQYFIISSKLGKTQKILKSAISKAIAGVSYNDYLAEFSNRLFQDLLFSNLLKTETALSLTALLKIAKIIQVYQSLENRQELLKQAFEELKHVKDLIKSFGRSYLDFVHGYINACITVHKDNEALKVMNSTLMEIDQMYFSNLREKEICFGKLLNRKCVLYKAVRLNNEAIVAGEASLSIAKKYSDLELELKNYLDIANVYGRKKEKLNETLLLWKYAINIYRSNREVLGSQRAMVELYEGQFHLLIGNEKEGLKILRDGVKYCEAHSIHFFHVKYLLVQVIWALSNRKSIDLEMLSNILYRSKDLAIRFQITRTYWKILYIEAKIIEFRNPSSVLEIIEIYIQVMNQFVYTIRSPGIEEYNISIFEAMAHFVMSNRDYPLNESFQLLSKSLLSTEVKNSMQSIFVMSEQQLTIFYDLREPELIFHDGKFDFPIIG